MRYNSSSLSVILQGSLFFSRSAASCSISSSFRRYGSIISSKAEMLRRHDSCVVRTPHPDRTAEETLDLSCHISQRTQRPHSLQPHPCHGHVTGSTITPVDHLV